MDLSGLVRLEEIDGAMAKTLENITRAGVNMLIVHTAKSKLENRNPPYLNVQTRTLYRSFTSSADYEITPERVAGSYGPKVLYGRWHQEGFSGTVTVPGHQRGPYQVAEHEVREHKVRAHQRRTKSGGTVEVPEHSVRAHSVKAHQVGRHDVAEHEAQLNVRARYWVSHALDEKRPELETMARQGLVRLHETGRPPSVGSLFAGAP